MKTALGSLHMQQPQLQALQPDQHVAFVVVNVAGFGYFDQERCVLSDFAGSLMLGLDRLQQLSDINGEGVRNGDLTADLAVFAKPLHCHGPIKAQQNGPRNRPAALDPERSAQLSTVQQQRSPA